MKGWAKVTIATGMATGLSLVMGGVLYGAAAPVALEDIPFFADRAKAGEARRWLESVRTELSLTPKQEALWQGVIQQWHDRQTMQCAWNVEYEDGDAAMSQRIDRLEENLRAQATADATLGGSVKNFYANLTPEQKDSAEGVFRERCGDALKNLEEGSGITLLETLNICVAGSADLCIAGVDEAPADLPYIAPIGATGYIPSPSYDSYNSYAYLYEPFVSYGSSYSIREYYSYNTMYRDQSRNTKTQYIYIYPDTKPNFPGGGFIKPVRPIKPPPFKPGHKEDWKGADKGHKGDGKEHDRGRGRDRDRGPKDRDDGHKGAERPSRDHAHSLWDGKPVADERRHGPRRPDRLSDDSRFPFKPSRDKADGQAAIPPKGTPISVPGHMSDSSRPPQGQDHPADGSRRPADGLRPIEGKGRGDDDTRRPIVELRPIGEKGKAEAEKRQTEERQQRQAEAEKRQAEEQQQRQAEAQKRQAEEQQRRQAEAQKRQTEEQQQRQAEAEKRQTEERQRRQAEAQKRQTEEQQQRQAEAQKRQTEEQQQRQAEEQQQRQAEAQKRQTEEQQQRQAEAQKRQAEEQQRRQAEAQKRQAEEQQQRQAEAQKRQTEEQQQRQAEAQKRQAEEQQQRQAEAQKRQAEEQQRRQAEAQQRQAEEQQRRQAEAQQRQAEEQQRRQAEAQKRQAEEQQRRQAEAQKRQAEEQQRRQAEAQQRQVEEQQRRQAEKQRQ